MGHCDACLVALVDRQIFWSQHDPQPLPLFDAAFCFQAKQVAVPYNPLLVLVHMKATELAGVPSGTGPLLWNIVWCVLLGDRS